MKMKTQPIRTHGTQHFLRGKFIATSAYIKYAERSEINDLMLYLKLEKQEQAKPKARRRRQIIKTRAKNQ
jgi:hypothetical protein